jgi:hypothetical protein
MVIAPEGRSRRRNSFRGMAHLTLRKIWPRSKSEKTVMKNVKESYDEPELLAQSTIECSSHDEHESNAFPVEVTVIDDYCSEKISTPPRKYFSNHRVKRLEVAEAEATVYLKQLHSTQEFLDILTRDLNKSRGQVAELINQNTILLEELKAVAGKDDASLESHRMMRQELIMLKGCLFFSAIFVFCGGRASLLLLVAAIWMVADLST